jgi:hypothetical protein
MIQNDPYLYSDKLSQAKIILDVTNDPMQLSNIQTHRHA